MPYVQTHQAFDPDDVSWLDDIEDEGALRIREITLKRTGTQPADWDADTQVCSAKACQAQTDRSGISV